MFYPCYKNNYSYTSPSLHITILVGAQLSGRFLFIHFFLEKLLLKLTFSTLSEVFIILYGTLISSFIDSKKILI